MKYGGKKLQKLPYHMVHIIIW